MNEAACKRLFTLTRRAYSWRDPAIQIAAALLAVLFIGLATGFLWAIRHERLTELQLRRAVAAACITYTQSIAPRRMATHSTEAIWIGENCGRIANAALARFKGMTTGVTR